MSTPEAIRMKLTKRLAIYDSPVRLLVFIAVTIFVTHTVAMVMFASLPQFPMWIESLIESILLLILLFPVLYMFSLRPLLVHISEQQQAERIMRESEHKYRQLFESLSDAALLIDRETGRILDANQRAQSLLGYSRGEIMGMNQSKLSPAGEILPRPGLSNLPHEDESGNCETVVVNQAGSILPVHVSAAPLVLFGRTLVLALVRDLTAGTCPGQRGPSSMMKVVKSVAGCRDSAH